MQCAAASLTSCQPTGLAGRARSSSSSSRASRPAAAAPRRQLAVRAATDSNSSGNGGISSLDGGKGLFNPTSSLLGPKPNLSGPASSSSLGTSNANKPQLKLEDVELKSGVNVSYVKLRDHLAAGEWREAEDELREVLIQAAGPAAVKRGWVYFSEVKFIPVEDMRTMDELWRAASGGKFGYSVQREMWVQQRRQWTKFFKAIEWVQGENNIYKKWPQEFDYSQEAPRGHLPLTNALRGTRLFEAILEHEAFEKKAVGSGNGSLIK